MLKCVLNRKKKHNTDKWVAELVGMSTQWRRKRGIFLLNITKRDFIKLIERLLMRVRQENIDSFEISQEARRIYREAMPSVGGSIDRFILYGYTVFLEKREECDGLASVEEHMDLSFVIPRRSLLLFLEQVAILQNATPEEAKRNAEAVVTWFEKWQFKFPNSFV